MSDLEEKLQSGKEINIIVKKVPYEDIKLRKFLRSLHFVWDKRKFWRNYAFYNTAMEEHKKEAETTFKKLVEYKKEHNKDIKIKVVYSKDL